MDGSIIADAKVATDHDLAATQATTNQPPVAKGPTPLEGAPRPANGLTRVPGELFGEAPVAGRKLDAGMGLAVARRTVFRPSDAEDFGRVADRVSVGNMSLLGRPLTDGELKERARLRNAIATGALITSGRHLQHGDAGQADRNMELYTNCATAIASFSKFYLLMNGSGVGRAYDDELCVVDWGKAPKVVLALSTEHPDHPLTRADLHRYGSEWGILPWGTTAESMTDEQLADITAHRDREFVASAARAAAQARAEGRTVVVHEVKDSREGWGKALEVLEAMAHRGESDTVLVLDFSSVRPRGTPIMGMQGRPASGPLSPMRAFASVRQHVIEPARGRTADDEMLQPWAQALMVDHYFSVEVQVGGARRAARMATKSWRDKGVHKFIRSKSAGGLWTANHSVTVDAEFWERVERARSTVPSGVTEAAMDPMDRHALSVFEEVTRCAYINGEPGLINADMLNDHKTGQAWQKPVNEDGRDFRSTRYQVDEAAALLADCSRRASTARFPMTTNPCGEIPLHVTGGYCVIADYAPLLACPVDHAGLTPGEISPELAAEWDQRIEESVRLGVRFLVRANTMDALYGEEVRRTNRIGVGPTGLHEYAWVRFGLDFNDLLDEAKSAPFWAQMARFSEAAKQEADLYADELGVARPFTVTTVKPAGTTSKLFGLTEGVHLPARRQYLRWVQFKGTKDSAGNWSKDADPLLADYEAKGYPIKALKTFPGMSIVGYPTLPLIQRLGIGERVVTAPEATPEDQYKWLKLIEKHWIGAERGNQVSYTLKVYTDKHDLESFRDMTLREQPEIRCCSILPSKPDHQLGYEYLPEEQVAQGRFAYIVENIRDEALHQAIDMKTLECASGACPI